MHFSRWRTSTWIYAFLVVCAIVAEVIYATSSNPETQALQGHGFGWLIVATLVFVLYQLATSHRDRDR
jgi:hypothetical protein